MIFKKMTMVFIFLSLILLFCGCSNSSNKSSTTSSESNKLRDRVALNIEDILKGKEGKYAGDRYDKRKVEKELEQTPKNASDKEIFNRIVDLVGEDFSPEKKAFDDFDIFYKTGKKPDDDIKNPEKKPENIAILLDSSGSMSSNVSGGQKMVVAKEAVQQFVNKAPKEAKVSLTAYGHKGSNSKADKNKSCRSVEEVYPLGSMDKEKFDSALKSLKPTGWTPIARAISQARATFSKEENKKSNNVVFVVSDGLETCGGNPSTEAKKMVEANVKASVNIIGFDVNNEEQKQLKKVAESGGGTYFTAQSKRELNDYFNDQYEKMRKEWRNYDNRSQLKFNDDFGNKYSDLRNLNESIDKKKKNEEDRFHQAIEYIRDKRDAYSLTPLALKRREAITQYFLDRYGKTSNAVSDNYKKSKNKLDKDVKKGFDGVEKN
ncbi:Ca-activated chloride channel family protein [Marininema mesophilum]|uniref:Ca-activated chloride channel family protein n=1 Tax=Marininema mesophilum TaxID=1048340 RepID=A0A1H2X523_9BACL|nr:VWA domain-containing protein [Marininema mesophilum]SDW87846.1 Ca-activated chloride channel family protein [Marininema mesophilum]